MASAIPGGLKQNLQGMTYNNPQSKDLFRIANIDYKPQLEVSPTYVANMLRLSSYPNITFKYSLIDKPQGGQMYIISMSPNATEIPSDGYIYLDAETTHKIVLPDGKELLCMERQGFAPGEQVVNKIRRRYRFANDHQDLQLLHYSLSALPDGRQQQVVPPYARHPTQGRYSMTPMAPMQASMNPYGRPPNAISPMAIQQPGPSSMHTPPSALARGPITGTPTPMGNSYVQFQTRNVQRGPQPGMPQTPTKSTGRRTKGAKNKAAAVAAAAASAAEEADEPSGDEIDNLKFREVAMSRFKRNHDYISEIFSAYSISSIIPPTSVYREKNIDELKQQLAAHQEEIEKLNIEHSKKVEEFKRQSNLLSKSMNDLSKCNAMEELLELQRRTEEELDILIRPFNPVTLIQIRDDPESDVEVESHNDLMQEDAISEELLMEGNSGHEGLVELDQGLSHFEIGKDLANTSELHNTPGIEELEELKDIPGIGGIEGMGGIDNSGLNEDNLQGYFSSANMPGLTNDPNLQLGELSGDPNLDDHPNYTGIAINTNYGGDSFEDYIHNPDEVMDDEVPLS